MTKNEFKETIKQSEKLLREKRCYGEDKYWSVCESLSRVVHPHTFYVEHLPIIREFSKLFKPETRESYWFGRPFKANINQRLVALRLFEQVVIDEGSYKAF